MASKCTACGKRISTWQEFTTVVSGAVGGIWRFISENAAGILKLVGKRGGFDVGIGVFAGPLNVNKLPCPHCRAIGRWVDD